MSLTIIVQARMTSSRLPGKVLAPVLGRPLLWYQIERLRRVKEAARLVIATTVNKADDPIVSLCLAGGVDHWRGSEDDVLSRYFETARHFAASTVVRVTADCPLIDPSIVDAAIAVYSQAGGQLDYVSNMMEPTWPYGMAVEVLSVRALSEANAEAREAAEREHVTPFIYWRPARYRLRSLTRRPNLSHMRWTVDTPEDFELVRRIIEALYPSKPDFAMEDVLALLGEHPAWQDINRHVQQRQVLAARKEP
jgi:spore coat polysaccharide biosynthesis protein SpsF